MFDGMLEVEGSFRPASLWPTGTSDADTTTLVVEARPESFRFRESTKAKARTTRAFDSATVVGRVRKKAVDEQHRVVVRLQGIDAPELHYRAACLVSPERRTAAQQLAFAAVSAAYRQPLAEAATLALRAFIGGSVDIDEQDHTIPCLLRTRVDQPGDVFDTYGRMVAEAFVRKGGRWVSLNQWLATSGWAVPTFYSSMRVEEIEAFTHAGNQARKAGAGLWRHYRASAGGFGWLRYRGKGAAVDTEGDVGNVIFPKLFRRQCAWAVNRRGGTTPAASLKAFLSATKDACFRSEEFLAQGITAAQPRAFTEFVRGQGELEVRPMDLVFQEAASRLIGRNGGDVAWW